MGRKDNGASSTRGAVLFAAVPPDLHLRARVRALEEGRPVARLIEDAVARYLEVAAPA